MGNTSETAHRPPNDPSVDNEEASWIKSVENSRFFVWCDASIGNRTFAADDKNTILRLAQVVNQHRQLVHTFNNLHACREFITTVNNVCLIISGSFGQELVPIVHQSEQIRSIYVFCLNRAKHEAWALNYPKVRGVYTEIKEICDSLKSELMSQSSYEYDRLEFDIVNKESDPSSIEQQELILIYSKLTQLIHVNMTAPDHGKQDLIDYCRSEYNREQLIRLINEFERNYSQKNPLWWYTRDCFFQGIVNRALRSHDLYTSTCMYRFLKDLNCQLSQLQYSQGPVNELIRLYFGQFFSKDDFERIKINRGGLMCINQFVSANLEQAIAVMFIKQHYLNTHSPQKVRILFEITIDRSVPSIVPYAGIGAVSQFVHEKEYLISMGSIYRVNAIEKFVDVPSAWVVHLTLVGQNDYQYNLFTQCIERSRWEKEMNLSELGHLIKKKFQLFRSSNRLFKHAMKNKPHEFRYLMLNYNMAMILAAMNENEKSIEEYRYTLTLARHYIPTCYNQDDLCLIPVYSNMALIYQQDNRFSNALEHAFRALEILSKSGTNSNIEKDLSAACYETLGLIHDQDGKYRDARNFYEQALRIRQAYLPLGHRDLTTLQRIITLLVNKPSDSSVM